MTTEIPVYLEPTRIVRGESSVEWQPDGNEVKITMKLNGDFEGDELAGLIQEELVALAFIRKRDLNAS